MNEEQGQRGEDGRLEEVIWVEDDLNPFDLLPDELLEILITQSLSAEDCFLGRLLDCKTCIRGSVVLFCNTSAHFHDYTLKETFVLDTTAL